MLAEGGWKAFDDDRWWFEPKFDGIRSTTYMATDSTRLVTRRGRDVSAQYPELHMVHELVNQVNAVIDAEIVAFDDDGRNSFEALQQRMNLLNEREIKQASQKVPVAMVAFDLLWLDGMDVTGLSLQERRELLASVVEEDERLQDHARRGLGQGLRRDGEVARARGHGHGPSRARDTWMAGALRLAERSKLTNTQDCVILGWTPGQGGRARSFGALLVGAYDDGELLWVGQVGTGFTGAMLDRLMEACGRSCAPPPPSPSCAGAKGATFVEPSHVCEVEYLEITKSTRKMRAPSFKGPREDKVPEDCVLERGARKGSNPARTRSLDLTLVHAAVRRSR